MNNSEHVEQCALLQWWEMQARAKKLDAAALFAIPNGGNRNAATGARLKAEGVRSGIPDLMLAIPSLGYAGLFIEMKRCRGGQLGARQKEMLAMLERNGYATAVCHGFEAARSALCLYLGWKSPKKALPRHAQAREVKKASSPWENWGGMEEDDAV